MTSKYKQNANSSGIDYKWKSLLCVPASALIFMFGGVSTMVIGQERNSIDDLPMALLCGKDQSIHVGYLTKVNADGSAFYMTINNAFVEVAPNGVVGDRSGGTCSGKSLDELRALGQTRDFADK